MEMGDSRIDLSALCGGSGKNSTYTAIYMNRTPRLSEDNGKALRDCLSARNDGKTSAQVLAAICQQQVNSNDAARMTEWNRQDKVGQRYQDCLNRYSEGMKGSLSTQQSIRSSCRSIAETTTSTDRIRLENEYLKQQLNQNR